MQSQGSTFPDAVASLAAEAGLDVPRPSPAQAEADRKRLDQYAVLDATQRGFRRRLGEAAGAAARDYLARRGVFETTIETWGLGWSGPGRGDLARELGEAGITPEMLAQAGLMRLGADGEAAGELFFNRLTFPIRDPRGRVVSFGGRVLGDGQPKYLNGPETDLFSKRRTLFGLDRAATGVRGGQKLVVVEGYMDVIALHQAGFSGAVAPLGTALTEDQLGLLWKLSPIPILCFDGDAAGGRAAARTAELALPLLAPDRSLKVARLPSGEDPDSLVRNHGAAKLAAELDRALPLVEALYALLREQAGETTPEARAAFRQRLVTASGQIADRALAREFRATLLDRFFAERRHKGAPKYDAPPRAAPDASVAQAIRWRLLLCLLLRHPALLNDVHEAFALLRPPPSHARLQAALLDLHGRFHGPDALDSGGLMNHLRSLGLADDAAQAVESVAGALPASASEGASPAEVEATWWHFFGLMDPTRLDEEIAQARAAFEGRADAQSQRRLVAMSRARAQILSGEDDLDHG